MSGLSFARIGPHFKLLTIAGAIAFALCASAPAADPSIIRIEEDWEIVVGTPDPTTHAPQIIQAMSTTNRLADVHCVFEVNHKTQPQYTPGHVQLQCWSGDSLLAYGTSGKSGLLSTAGEVVRYTVVMELKEGCVVFSVKNCSSTTWSDFNSLGYLKCRIPTPQLYFPNYSPDFSVANSKITYAAHCVQKVAQKEVRYYTVLGLLASKDTTERVAHQLSN